MRRLILDFETYYDAEYSLRRMDPWSFVSDPRFVVSMLAYQWYDDDRPDGEPRVLYPPDVERFLASCPWSDIEVVAHNAVFDGLVLARYGYRPGRWFCTLQAAHQWIYPLTGGVSLAAVADAFGLDVGHKNVIEAMRGRRIEHLDPGERELFERYACHDVRLAGQLRTMLTVNGTEVDEAVLIDWTIRQSVEPRLMVDADALDAAAEREEAELLQRIEQLGYTKEQFSSAAKFAALLESFGVTVPRKQGKAGLVPAVAKTDPFMESLVDSEDPLLSELAGLRLGVASTITRTRARSMAQVGRACGGRLPVPLHWHRARTGRWTGAAGLNMQNLSRGASLLRSAIHAPPGYELVVVDAAQIEARILATLAGAEPLVEAFAAGRDVYAEFASTLYGTTVTKQTHPRERQVGKLAVLSLGYGCGAEKFRHIARVQGGIDLGPDEAARVVATYRRTYYQIVALWEFLDRVLRTMCVVGEYSFVLPGCPSFELYWSAPALWLPSGRPILYPDLQRWPSGEVVTTRHSRQGAWTKAIWGGAVTENLVQAAARDVLCRAHVAVVEAVVHQVHDELVALAPVGSGEELKRELVERLRAAPSWLRGCPLDAEGKVVTSYGEAK